MYKGILDTPLLALRSEKYYEQKYNKMTDKKLYKKGSSDFSGSLVDSKYNRNKYFDRLSKQGYNFIIDDNDAGKIAKDPMIIFNGKQVLNKIASKKLTELDTDKAFEYTLKK